MSQYSLDPEQYNSERDRWYEIRVEQEMIVDRQLTYLSSGAIALTINFTGQLLAGGGSPQAIWVLVTSWGLFVSTVVLVLLSHKASAREADEYIEWLDEGREMPSKSYDPGKITNRLNNAAWITFLLAIASTLVFVSINILPKVMNAQGSI